MQASSPFPIYTLCDARPEDVKAGYHVLTKQESQIVPELHREIFNKNGQVTVHDGLKFTTYLTPSKVIKVSIDQNAFVQFSPKVCALDDYFGVASDLLSRAHKFSRKQKPRVPPTVHISKNAQKLDEVLKLTEGKNKALEYANGRGDYDGVPSYFQKQAKQFSTKHSLQFTIIKGQDLVKDGFRLMHAVGRASKNQPTFINIKYKGNADSDNWIAFVGKGVCFDAGGLNIKPTSGIKDMYLDKHGACSVFSAFQTLVEQKAKVNVTVSMGFVQNYVGSNSFRPSDIITSRKGINVQIGNTDAEGRLVLADCMNWTQQKYSPKVLIQLSTLTGAVIIALGHKYAGLFSNDDELSNNLTQVANQIHEPVWRMPVTQYHHELIKHKFGDITNSSGKTQASSSQAAAFLQNFVEEGVKWVHLDIAGAAMVSNEGNGFGARLLIQYARNYAQ